MSVTGNTRTTSAENKEHDGNLHAKRVTDAPAKFQERWDWTSGSLDYHGYADMGVDEGTSSWFLEKWTWVSGNPTKKQLKINGSWTNRASESYT